ncbi:hypothetical protein [Nonomuraea aurantiaca]|uniref:hypothetical protein n=1 Tax=Nonomuraea aurantiaca TaxID=2878562 RepID=UPI0027E20AE9|nr:hypothetical protein [Nonomuraea aurantiaca]
MSHPPVEVGLGVLRPGMAGAVADVAITWMTPSHYLEDTLLPALTAGAEGRPRRPRGATVVHVALAAPGRDPRRLAYRAAAGHLRAPHHTDMLRRAGMLTDPADPRAGAAALVEAGVYVYGTAVEVAQRLRGHRADEIVPHCMSTCRPTRGGRPRLPHSPSGATHEDPPVLYTHVRRGLAGRGGSSGNG